MKRLLLFLFLISLSVFAQRPDYKDFGFAHDYDRIFEYVDKLMGRKGVQDMFNEIFVEELVAPDELVLKYSLSSNKMPFTENQLVFLLTKNEDLFSMIDDYLDKFPENISLNDLVTEYKLLEKQRKKNISKKLSGKRLKRYEELTLKIENLKKFKEKFHSIVEAPEVKNVFTKLSDPIEPVKLLMADNAVAWNLDPVKGFATTHEKMINGKIVAADNTVKFITDFIDSAEKQLKVMVFEQDLEEVLFAVRRALERGVDVEVGLDGKHLSTQSKLIYDKVMTTLEKDFPPKNVDIEAKAIITNPKPHLVAGPDDTKVAIGFKEESEEIYNNIMKKMKKEFPKSTIAKNIGSLDYRPVTISVGLDHSKLFVKDWDIPGKGSTIISTGNVTSSGIHPLGDAPNISPKARAKIKNLRPNANHMHMIESDLYALVTKHEIDKTFKLGLRGKSDMWATSFYSLKGEKFKGFKKASDLIFTFTPGGLDDPTRFFMSNLLERSTGTIRLTLFAASSEDFANSLIDYALKEFKTGNVRPFESVMDASFSTRFYSMLFKIGGYKEVFSDQAGNTISMLEARELDKSGIAYVREVIDDLDSHAMKSFSPKQLETMRDSMRLATKHYSESHFQDIKTKKSIRITSKVHLKAWSTDNMVQTGSSNYSPSAADQKEALAGISNHPVIKKHKEAFEGLNSLTDKSIDDRVLRRNLGWDKNYKFDLNCSKLMK